MNKFRPWLAFFGAFTRVVPTEPTGAGAMSTHVYDSGEVALATDGATTDIAAAIPAGACVRAVSAEIVDAITGISADSTVTAALTGGSTETIVPFSTSRAAGTHATQVFQGLQITGSAGGIRVTIATGADNTPTGGSVRIVLHYDLVATL